LLAEPPPAAEHPGWLGGLPVTVKDTVDVEGVPTTYGSTVYRTNIAAASSPLIARLERLGAIVVGKTNVPEFCSGADTANALFGRTANPFDAAVSCGASSGGAAVSVATGEVWCALGEDTAGSIRIPASFCSVVGLRPTPGIVPGTRPTDPLTAPMVPGPLARTVDDARLFFGAMLGGRVPALDPAPRAIAYSPDLGGAIPVDADIARVCADAVAGLVRGGYRVEEAAPPLDGLPEACQTLLAYRAFVAHGERVDRLGESLCAEVAAGRAVNAEQLADAQRTQSRFMDTVEAMFDRYDVLVTPAFGCPPWPVPADPSPLPEARYLPGILAAWPLTMLATMAALPALTVPCGQTPAGHPVGLQLIGRPSSDLRLLDVAGDVERWRGPVPGTPVTP
jgi:amidase